MSNYDFDLVWARMSELEERISALEADAPQAPQQRAPSLDRSTARDARLRSFLNLLRGPGVKPALRDLGALVSRWREQCSHVGTWCSEARMTPDIVTLAALVWDAPEGSACLYAMLPAGAPDDLEEIRGYLYRGGRKFGYKGLAAFRAHATEFFDLPQERVEESEAEPTAFDTLARALRASAGNHYAHRAVEAVLKGLEKPLRGLPARFGDVGVQWIPTASRGVFALCLTWHWKSETYRLRVEPIRRNMRWDLAWCATDVGVFANSRVNARKDVLQVLRDAFARENARSTTP